MLVIIAIILVSIIFVIKEEMRLLEEIELLKQSM